MELSVSVSLLSGALVAQFPVPRNATVFDVKTRLHDQDGTSVRKQQLVLGCDILQDTTALSELAELGSDHLDLRLVRKEGVSFVWQVPADRGCVTSPEWCLDQSEAVSTRRCALSLRFYPCGFESKMYKEGNFSIMVRRPKNSIVRARVHVAGTVRERVFTSAHGTEEGWVNFASQDLLPSETQDINLEVLHCSIIPPPQFSENRVSWDLREALGRMPYEIGVPFVEEARIESCEGTSVHLRLTFFPGGHTAAPPNHVSLWVLPLHGLEDRSYSCTVDGSAAQRSSGESVLHFPRVEVFGDINLSVCRLPSPDAPRRLRRFSETS